MLSSLFYVITIILFRTAACNGGTLDFAAKLATDSVESGAAHLARLLVIATVVFTGIDYSSSAILQVLSLPPALIVSETLV